MIGRVLLGLGAWVVLAVGAAALWGAIARALERRRQRFMVEDVLFEAEAVRHPILRDLYLPEDRP